MVIRPYDLLFARSAKNGEKNETGAGGKKSATVPLALFEEFSRHVNADFSDILMIIEGYTQIALRKLREGRLTEEHLQHILKTLRRGTGVTEDISVFLARLPMPEDICDLTEAVRLVVDTLQVREGIGDTVLPLVLPEDPCPVYGGLETVAHVLTVFLPHVYGAEGSLADISLSLERRVLKDRREQAVLNIHCIDDAEVLDNLDARLFHPAAIQVKGPEDCLTRLYLAYVLVERMGGCVCSAPGQGARGGRRFQLLFPVALPPV